MGINVPFTDGETVVKVIIRQPVDIYIIKSCLQAAAISDLIDISYPCAQLRILEICWVKYGISIHIKGAPIRLSLVVINFNNQLVCGFKIFHRKGVRLIEIEFYAKRKVS